MGAKSSKRIRDCHEMLKAVITVNNKDSVINAFDVMVERDITGVAVVDEQGRLIDHISVRDLKLIGVDSGMFWRLQQSVRTFTHQLYKDLVRKRKHIRRIVYVTPDAIIQDVITCFVKYAVHRVYVVDNHEQRRPIGVCSHHDVIRQVIS